MKASTPFQQRYLLAAVVLAITIGCTPQKPELEPPIANAVDHILAFPADTVLLDGRSSISFGQISSYEWKKIAGPSNYNIKNAQSPVATVTNLQAGTYQFELTVTNNNNLHGKDTVTVDVFEVGPGASEVNFKSLQWNDFWGFYLEVNNFHSFVPATMFSVFVKSNNAAGWMEAVHAQQWQNQLYKYDISNSGALWIESNGQEVGTADVKILF